METIHAALDGADRSGHGAKDVLKVCLARSSVGAEPAPTGAGKKAPPAGPSTIGGSGLSWPISGDAVGITRRSLTVSSEDHAKAIQQGFCMSNRKLAARWCEADLVFLATGCCDLIHCNGFKFGEWCLLTLQ